MDNQTKDLKLEKDKKMLCKRGKKKVPKESWKMQEKKASSWRKQDLRIACKNFLFQSESRYPLCNFK